MVRYICRIATVLLEGDNPATSLVRFISDSGITNLVLGSCSSNCITRYNFMNFDITCSIDIPMFPDVLMS